MSGCGFYREVEIDSLLCRDPYSALLLLAVVISTVHIHGRAQDCLGVGHPFGPALDAPSCTSCHRQVLVEAFFEFL